MRPDPTERHLAEQAHALDVSTTASDEATIVTMYLVASDIDGGVYGPFSSYAGAVAFAEPADGSVFECTMHLVEV